MIEAETAVLFGGTGFIGSHLAQHLLREGRCGKIVLVDRRPPSAEPWAKPLQEGLREGRIEHVQWDLRQPIPATLLRPRAELVFNLAAIHREPGHKPHEYFETNLLGAEHVCAWAAAAQCPRIVFTSSISPYGASDATRDEQSLPVPETPYGSSKLAAEKVHLAWQAGAAGRRLLVLRPGVVFGPGEDGNVTRLVRSIVKGYFVYAGNRQTRKAGGYVKELCSVIQFALERQECTDEGVLLLNFGMHPVPTLEEYVDAIRKAAGIRRAPASIPNALLLGAAYPIDALARTFGISQPVNPVRVRKLTRSTHVDPRWLREAGYCWKYSMESAFRDWKENYPQDFSSIKRR